MPEPVKQVVKEKEQQKERAVPEWSIDTKGDYEGGQRAEVKAQVSESPNNATVHVSANATDSSSNGWGNDNSSNGWGNDNGSNGWGNESTSATTAGKEAYSPAVSAHTYAAIPVNNAPAPDWPSDDAPMLCRPGRGPVRSAPRSEVGPRPSRRNMNDDLLSKINLPGVDLSKMPAATTKLSFRDSRPPRESREPREFNERPAYNDRGQGSEGGWGSNEPIAEAAAPVTDGWGSNGWGDEPQSEPVRATGPGRAEPARVQPARYESVNAVAARIEDMGWGDEPEPEAVKPVAVKPVEDKPIEIKPIEVKLVEPIKPVEVKPMPAASHSVTHVAPVEAAPVAHAQPAVQVPPTGYPLFSAPGAPVNHPHPFHPQMPYPVPYYQPTQQEYADKEFMGSAAPAPLIPHMPAYPQMPMSPLHGMSHTFPMLVGCPYCSAYFYHPVMYPYVPGMSPPQSAVAPAASQPSQN